MKELVCFGAIGQQRRAGSGQCPRWKACSRERKGGEGLADYRFQKKKDPLQ